MMSLEDAIKHCEEVAEENEIQAEALADFDGSVELQCLECANEHRQLAEWLRELMGYRKAYKWLKSRAEMIGNWDRSDYKHRAEGMYEAVEIMDKRIQEVKADADSN